MEPYFPKSHMYGARTPGENRSKSKTCTTRMRLQMDSRDRDPTLFPNANDFRFHMAVPLRGVTAITMTDLWCPMGPTDTLTYTYHVSKAPTVAVSDATVPISLTIPGNTDVYITGAATQLVNLPAQSIASPYGYTFRIQNESAALCTVKDSAAVTVATIASGVTKEFMSLDVIPLSGWQVTTTAGLPYRFVIPGPKNLFVTGTDAQLVTLPGQTASTPYGSVWRVHNESTGLCSIQDIASVLQVAIGTGVTAELTSLGPTNINGWTVVTYAGLSLATTTPSYTYVVPVLADLPENIVAQYKEGSGYPSGVLGFIPLIPAVFGATNTYHTNFGSKGGHGGSWRIEFPFAMGQLSELHMQLWAWAGDASGTGWGGAKYPPALFPFTAESLLTPPDKNNNYWIGLEIEHQM